jgi:hypothetical protein
VGAGLPKQHSLGQQHCFVLMMEVLDNLPHDRWVVLWLGVVDDDLTAAPASKSLVCGANCATPADFGGAALSVAGSSGWTPAARGSRLQWQPQQQAQRNYSSSTSGNTQTAAGSSSSMPRCCSQRPTH